MIKTTIIEKTLQNHILLQLTRLFCVSSGICPWFSWSLVTKNGITYMICTYDIYLGYLKTTTTRPTRGVCFDPNDRGQCIFTHKNTYFVKNFFEEILFKLVLFSLLRKILEKSDSSLTIRTLIHRQSLLFLNKKFNKPWYYGI